MRIESLFVIVLFAWAVAANAQSNKTSSDLRGHTKLNLTAQSFPDDSLFRGLLSAETLDLQGNFRLNFEWRRSGFEFDAGYELIALHGDTPELSKSPSPDAELLFPALPGDARRLFDLTDEIADGSKSALLHRLDRLSLGFASEKWVVRAGRQALSWGNGLFYAPMDLVNPFDPAAIDTEYKAGDDMLYSQYLRDSGHDVQAAAVIRRDPVSRDVESNQGTAAIKYHGFAGEYEYDVLVAESYDDSVLGIGLSKPFGGAIWSADLVLTDTRFGTEAQLVTNLSYSWVSGGRNMSGIIEYHFNGFGQSNGEYAIAELASNPSLVERLVRGQSFTLGRHYFAGSVLIEMTPLWTITPVLLANVDDPSALLQFTTNYSIADNMSFLGSLNLPLGPDGSEFGGIDSGLPGQFFSTRVSVFAQFAWYF